MTKLAYLAAVGLLGLGFTVAQNTTTPSDSSNSNGANKSQVGAASGKAASTSSQTPMNKTKGRSQGSQSGVPDTTVRDQQSSTTSTTGASGQSETRPSTSTTMGTTGSTPGTEDATPADKSAQPGNSTDQQPNSSSSPTPPAPHLVMMNQTPAARAVATHTPDPGTCMNPAAVQTSQYPSAVPARNCE